MAGRRLQAIFRFGKMLHGHGLWSPIRGWFSMHRFAPAECLQVLFSALRMGSAEAELQHSKRGAEAALPQSIGASGYTFTLVRWFCVYWHLLVSELW